MRAFWLLLPLCACGAAEREQPARLVPSPYPEFTVRSRWPSAAELRVQIDSSAAPLPAAEHFESALQEAFTAWSYPGRVGFTVVNRGEACDVVYSWKVGAHDSCSPFGHDARVAHTGPFPVADEPMFVHFDANADWSDDRALFRAALHETGHVLGLGHSADPVAVMHSERDSRRDRLRPSDVAGLASLYGTPWEGGANLALEDGSPILCGVLPDGLAEFALFDTDADGDSEVLIWRTDDAGHGVLRIYHFGPGPRVSHTVGPLIGHVIPGARIALVRTEQEEALFVVKLSDGTVIARVFEQGRLLPWSSEVQNILPSVTPWPDLPRSGDLDGDGARETLEPLE